MSRSVIMPTTRPQPVSSSTGTAPQSCSHMMRAASASVDVERHEQTCFVIKSFTRACSRRACVFGMDGLRSGAVVRSRLGRNAIAPWRPISQELDRSHVNAGLESGAVDLEIVTARRMHVEDPHAL